MLAIRFLNFIISYFPNVLLLINNLGKNEISVLKYKFFFLDAETQVLQFQ